MWRITRSQTLSDSTKETSGRSSAWLERLLWEQEVARSNRVAPITFPFKHFNLKLVFINRLLQVACRNWEYVVRMEVMSRFVVNRVRRGSYGYINGRWNSRRARPKPGLRSDSHVFRV